MVALVRVKVEYGPRRRHVAHGVADHFAAVDGILEGRLVVIGSAVLGGGFDAAALVDGDVNDGGTGLHGLHHGFGDQFRGQSAGDEDGTHEEVGVLGGGGDVEGVGGQGLDAAAEEVVDLAQAEEVAVKDGHASAMPMATLAAERPTVPAPRITT